LISLVTLAAADRPDPLARAEQLHLWGEAALRRYAVEAAGQRDVDKLWRLVEAHLTLHGGSGVGTSKHTLRAYKRGLVELVALWAGESLLRPARDAGALYVQRLRAGDREPVVELAGEGRRGRRPKRGPLAPATVELRLAAARALYDALRWAGATESDPFRDVRAGRDTHREEDVASLKVYTEYELVELLGRAEEPEDRVILLLGAHAGLRVSEMLALRWDAVDGQGRELVVRAGKGNKTAVVQLTPASPPNSSTGAVVGWRPGRATPTCCSYARSTASTAACAPFACAPRSASRASTRSVTPPAPSSTARRGT
jgi:integrase/recombinase XerC